MLVMQRMKVARAMFYVVPGVVLWVCTLESGVHATIAGVALGLLTPARPFGGRDVIEHLERTMHPWSSFLVIPVFALANAGVNLDLATIEHAATSPITWGIVVGLVVGKPLGIMAATGIGVLLRLGRLPIGLSFRHIFGASCIAGIGFTVSLFVADLSFQGVPLREAKSGILAASLLSAALGVGWLLSVRAPGSNRRFAEGAAEDGTVPPRNATCRAPGGAAVHGADQIYTAMADVVRSERRSISWERALLGLLIAIAMLEIVAALLTPHHWWALCAAPLLLGGSMVARTTRRRTQVIDELTFQWELYLGPHSPWTLRRPEEPTQ
jgi:hypothetical protein